MIKAKTLKGFRDFLPLEAQKRQKIIEIIRKIFELYGFVPLETPALEYAETLQGKYGSEADKLLYLFEDRGGRKVGLRYDLTVPLSRLIAQYQNLPKPFKRYQIQPVWRAEKPQSGRFREFLQCDIDIISSTSPLSDAEVVACLLSICDELGLKDRKVLLNDRSLFDNFKLTKEEIIILDKLEKVGEKEVLKELAKNGRKNSHEILSALKKSQPTKRLLAVFKFLEKYGFKENHDFYFYPFLARGLEYYTSTIFELKSKNYTSGSLAGGGRYDKLISLFTGINTPAVGASFGFDRLIEAMEKNKILPSWQNSPLVLVTVFSPELLDYSLKITAFLRQNKIPTELYLEENTKLDKQLKYADKKNIPYVIIIGPNEVKTKTVTFKNLKNKEQKIIDFNQICAEILKEN